MKTFRNIAGDGFSASRPSVAATELLLALAMAGMTVALWLFAAQAAPRQEPVLLASTAQAGETVYVTLPPVVVIGRSSPDSAPASATTAQNTTVFPIALGQ
jgi:hypothetical protein